MRNPATAGPATCAVDRVISSLVLPSIRLGRSTSAGMQDEDRHGGYREDGDLAPEHADAFAGPELEEIGMAPQLSAQHRAILSGTYTRGTRCKTTRTLSATS